LKKSHLSTKKGTISRGDVSSEPTIDFRDRLIDRLTQVTEFLAEVPCQKNKGVPRFLLMLQKLGIFEEAATI